MRLLLIEDDRETAEIIAEGLRGAGHELTTAFDGESGLAAALKGGWDVLVVDRMLPGLDGLIVVRELRSRSMAVPVLFLTTVGGISDRVEGLNAGADDYLVKPFAFPELVARIAALGRRSALAATPKETVIRVADLEIDLLARTVRRSSRPITLQPREYRLLEYLASNAGQVVTKTMLLEHVWNFHFDTNTTIVESHISRLRDKIGRDAPDLIQTIRGSGYSLSATKDG